MDGKEPAPITQLATWRSLAVAAEGMLAKKSVIADNVPSIRQ